MAAAQEERFTRIKHDIIFRFMQFAIVCAKPISTPRDLDYVGFYDKPLLKFDRLLETYLDYAPSGFQFISESAAALDEGETLDARLDSH